jgi:hypothetical protein
VDVLPVTHGGFAIHRLDLPEVKIEHGNQTSRAAILVSPLLALRHGQKR